MRKLKLQELNRLSIEDFKAVKKTPVALVLDNIRSGLNVGAAFRTADAFALEKIYLCGITAKPPHREILKTAIGATSAVSWEYTSDTETVISQLRAENYYIVGVEQTSESLELQNFSLPLTAKIALIFGNEVSGIKDAVLPLVDACVEVPQFGTKHSLNISVCIGIVVWEIFRKWKFSQD